MDENELVVRHDEQLSQRQRRLGHITQLILIGAASS